MAVTVSGTSITFNDATVQTTAAVAPTTATVLAATAGATVGAVGTYAYVYSTAVAQYTAGATIAGSSLRYSSGVRWGETCGNWFAANSTTPYSGTPAGTWRVMGYIASQASTSLVLRIS